ncbi:MAG: hypothetical protein ACI9JL_003430 [Paracoccaceae bacterium]|jgi:hypothetical protein
MMRFFLVPILLATIANFTVPGFAAAEPAYCAGRGAGPNANGKEASPFFFIAATVAAITGARAACGMDTSADHAFWQSYYRHKGCSDHSQVGKRMAPLVEQTIARYQRNAAKFQESQPDRYNKICERVKACVMPVSYPPPASSPGDKVSCIAAETLK